MKGLAGVDLAPGRQDRTRQAPAGSGAVPGSTCPWSSSYPSRWFWTTHTMIRRRAQAARTRRTWTPHPWWRSAGRIGSGAGRIGLGRGRTDRPGYRVRGVDLAPGRQDRERYRAQPALAPRRRPWTPLPGYRVRGVDLAPDRQDRERYRAQPALAPRRRPWTPLPGYRVRGVDLAPDRQDRARGVRRAALSWQVLAVGVP